MTQLTLDSPRITRRGGDGPEQPMWDDVRLYSPEWYRRFRNWHSERFPNADQVTRGNLEMLIRCAEEVRSDHRASRPQDERASKTSTSGGRGA